MIRAAALSSSRLQRALKVLSDGRPHTTRDLVRKARVMAVNAVVAELRHHGAETRSKPKRRSTPSRPSARAV